MPDILYIGEDCNPQWTGATGRSATTGVESFLNAATVTYALKTAAGVVVATGTLTYISGSDGNYIGVIESTVTADLTPGATYYLEYTLVQSPHNGFRRQKCRAQYRTD